MAAKVPTKLELLSLPVRYLSPPVVDPSSLLSANASSSLQYAYQKQCVAGCGQVKGPCHRGIHFPANNVIPSLFHAIIHYRMRKHPFSAINFPFLQMDDDGGAVIEAVEF